LNATAAFTRREAPGGDTQELEVAPQFFGNARVSYDFGGSIPTPSLAAYYVGERPASRAFDDTFVGIARGRPLAEFRATLSGPVPGLTGLSYRLSGAFATAAHAAYIVGPDSTGGIGVQDTPRRADLLPIDQFRMFVGLRYDFLGDDASEETP
jgi:hypothetical protein